MRKFARLFLLVLLAGSVLASAQAPSSADNAAAANPVAQIRSARRWEYGPFQNWGMGVGNRSNFKFLWTGFDLSKILTPVVHAGILTGQFEYGGNIIPLWLAFTPPPHPQTFTYKGQSYVAPMGGGDYHGVSITPVIFRWDFLTPSRRILPWFQAAGGLIYTTHKFPPDQEVPEGTPGGTCVWNFSPQGGGGIHYFIRPKRSIDLTVSGVHMSSASLGDRNPGVNASVQIQVGYTFWK